MQSQEEMILVVRCYYMVALMRGNATSVARDDTRPETAGSGEVVPHLLTTDLVEAEAEEEMVAEVLTMEAVVSGDSPHTKKHSKVNAIIVVSGVTRKKTAGNYKTRTREKERTKMKLVVLQWRSVS